MWPAAGEFSKRVRVNQNRNGLWLELLFFIRSWPDIYPAAEDSMDKDVIEGKLSQTESATCDDKLLLGTMLSSRCFSAASASCCCFLLKGLANVQRVEWEEYTNSLWGAVRNVKRCSKSQSVIVFSQFADVNCHSEYKYYSWVNHSTSQNVGPK